MSSKQLLELKCVHERMCDMCEKCGCVRDEAQVMELGVHCEVDRIYLLLQLARVRAYKRMGRMSSQFHYFSMRIFCLPAEVCTDLSSEARLLTTEVRVDSVSEVVDPWAQLKCTPGPSSTRGGYNPVETATPPTSGTKSTSVETATHPTSGGGCMSIEMATLP